MQPMGPHLSPAKSAHMKISLMFVVTYRKRKQCMKYPNCARKKARALLIYKAFNARADEVMEFAHSHFD